MSKTRRIAAWVLIVLLAGMFLMSAGMKIANPPEVREGFAKLNLTNWRLPLAIVEGGAALLLLIPRTHSLGLLLLTAYLGGAIATHLEQADAKGAISPAVMLALLWIAGLLRHPELLVSFRRTRPSTVA